MDEAKNEAEIKSASRGRHSRPAGATTASGAHVAQAQTTANAAEKPAVEQALSASTSSSASRSSVASIYAQAASKTAAPASTPAREARAAQRQAASAYASSAGVQPAAQAPTRSSASAASASRSRAASPEASVRSSTATRRANKQTATSEARTAATMPAASAADESGKAGGYLDRAYARANDANANTYGAEAVRTHTETPVENVQYGRGNYGSAGRSGDDGGAGGAGGKKKRGFWFWVMIISTILLVVSLAALGVIGFGYLSGQQKYEKVAEAADFKVSDIEGQPVVLKELTVDWDALKDINNDIVAWVYVPGTNINYPVVQARDNDYYLTRDFDGDQGLLTNFGAIFMDYRNSFDFSDMASYIYGHNMQDGSMFADLAGMTNQQRFDECRTVYLLTPEGNYKLRTFSLVHCPSTENIVQTTFATAQERTNYVQDKMDRSVCSADDNPQASDIKKMIVLATCDNYATDGRYLLYSLIEETTASGLYGNVGVGTAVGDDDSLTQSSSSSAAKK